MSIYGLTNSLFHLYHYTYETLKDLLEFVGFNHSLSFRIRLFDERNWQTLIGHELLYTIDTIPAILSRNKRHWNVILTEIYQRPENN